jgi:outer membrane protein TolC
MPTIVVRSIAILFGLAVMCAGGNAARADEPSAPRPPPTVVAQATSAAPMPPDYVAASTTLVDVPDSLMKVTPGGLIADQVAQQAAQTSYSAKAAQENLRGAAARVDAAWAAFLPGISLAGSYARLSDFAAPSLGPFVATNAPPGPINPANLPPGTGLVATNISFPVVLNNYLMEASISVPISDYFLRTTQNYTAAMNSQEAYRYDLIASKAKAASDGRLAFYTWLRARRAVVVATQALNDQINHLRDGRTQCSVGNASAADVLRAETAVSAAELAVERAKNLMELSEKQMRVAMHARASDTLLPGEELETTLPPVVGNLGQLTSEALSARFEVKSIDASANAAREQAAAQRAGRYPVLSGFADAIYADPNPRRFPQADDWFPTWDIGARLTWSPDEILFANSGATDDEARASALDAQRGAVRDGIEVEVLQAFQAVREADFSIDSGRRELASASEAYRVARALFNNGRATSTTLTDAETELTRARLDLLNAYVDARTARVRLDHAVGRDTRPFSW